MKDVYFPPSPNRHFEKGEPMNFEDWIDRQVEIDKKKPPKEFKIESPFNIQVHIDYVLGKQISILQKMIL